MGKKYLRKNEFRYYTNKQFLSKNGSPHIAHISVKYKHKNRFNLITHSNSFFGNDTLELYENPNRNRNKFFDKRKSKVSVPKWDNDSNFSKSTLSGWRFSKKDKKKIKKFNKKYIKKRN